MLVNNGESIVFGVSMNCYFGGLTTAIRIEKCGALVQVIATSDRGKNDPLLEPVNTVSKEAFIASLTTITIKLANNYGASQEEAQQLTVWLIKQATKMGILPSNAD